MSNSVRAIDPARPSFLSHLACARCGEQYPADRVQNLCHCGAPLLAQYHLDRVRAALRPSDLTGRSASLWRYKELLPLRDAEHPVTLGEGFTPLLSLPRLGATYGLDDLWIKEEGANPTGTFKARGAAVGVSRARELGISQLAMPTAGNAGGAWAVYAARAGMDLRVVMPADAPILNQREAFVVGARTFLVRGLISDAGAIVARYVKKTGAFDASTLKEPYRLEGKKTMGYEIAEQLGWKLPDAIIYPAGGGVGIIGIWKALQEMEALGWIQGRWPKLIVVQAEGCAPLVQAFNEGKEDSSFWQGASTIAAGIRVPKALGDFLVLRSVRETGGTAIAISDQQIVTAMRQTASQEGLWVCPEGAAAFAAAAQLRSTGFLKADERVVVLNTGAGLKYPELVAADLPVLDPSDDLPL